MGIYDYWRFLDYSEKSSRRRRFNILMSEIGGEVIIDLRAEVEKLKRQVNVLRQELTLLEDIDLRDIYEELNNIESVLNGLDSRFVHLDNFLVLQDTVRNLQLAISQLPSKAYVDNRIADVETSLTSTLNAMDGRLNESIQSNTNRINSLNDLYDALDVRVTRLEQDEPVPEGVSSTFTFNDTYSGLVFLVDGVERTVTGTTCTITLSEGNHYIRAYATDYLEYTNSINVSSTSHEFLITLTPAPTPTSKTITVTLDKEYLNPHVYLDNEEVTTHTANVYTKTGVTLGQHVLQVSASGCFTYNQTINVDDTHTDFPVSLNPVPALEGTVNINLDKYYPNAVVKLNGETLQYPYHKDHLPYGNYPVTVTCTGYEDYEGLVILDNETVTKNITLVPLGEYVTVNILTETSTNPHVYIDGTELTVNPNNSQQYFTTNPVSIGQHSLEVYCNDYEDYLTHITVDNEHTSFNVTLENVYINGSIILNDDYPDVFVRVDGNVISSSADRTYFLPHLASGDHDVVITATGYERFEEELYFGVGHETVILGLNKPQCDLTVTLNVEEVDVRINNIIVPHDTIYSYKTRVDQGTYTLTAFKEGFNPYSETITLDEDAITVNVELSIKSLSNFTGRIRDQENNNIMRAELYLNNRLLCLTNSQGRFNFDEYSPITEDIRLRGSYGNIKYNSVFEAPLEAEDSPFDWHIDIMADFKIKMAADYGDYIIYVDGVEYISDELDENNTLTIYDVDLYEDLRVDISSANGYEDVTTTFTFDPEHTILEIALEPTEKTSKTITVKDASSTVVEDVLVYYTYMGIDHKEDNYRTDSNGTVTIELPMEATKIKAEGYVRDSEYGLDVYCTGECEPDHSLINIEEGETDNTINVDVHLLANYMHGVVTLLSTDKSYNYGTLDHYRGKFTEDHIRHGKYYLRLTSFIDTNYIDYPSKDYLVEFLDSGEIVIEHEPYVKYVIELDFEPESARIRMTDNNGHDYVSTYDEEGFWVTAVYPGEYDIYLSIKGYNTYMYEEALPRLPGETTCVKAIYEEDLTPRTEVSLDFQFTDGDLDPQYGWGSNNEQYPIYISVDGEEEITCTNRTITIPNVRVGQEVPVQVRGRVGYNGSTKKDPRLIIDETIDTTDKLDGDVITIEYPQVWDFKFQNIDRDTGNNWVFTCNGVEYQPDSDGVYTVPNLPVGPDTEINMEMKGSMNKLGLHFQGWGCMRTIRTGIRDEIAREVRVTVPESSDIHYEDYIMAIRDGIGLPDGGTDGVDHITRESLNTVWATCYSKEPETYWLYIINGMAGGTRINQEIVPYNTPSVYETTMDWYCNPIKVTTYVNGIDVSEDATIFTASRHWKNTEKTHLIRDDDCAIINYKVPKQEQPDEYTYYANFVPRVQENIGRVDLIETDNYFRFNILHPINNLRVRIRQQHPMGGIRQCRVYLQGTGETEVIALLPDGLGTFDMLTLDFEVSGHLETATEITKTIPFVKGKRVYDIDLRRTNNNVRN